MAGDSPSGSTQQTTQRTRQRGIWRAPSMRTAVIVFVVLLILFRWLNLILALQIASTGRQIQIKTEELHKYERRNTALLQKISEAEAPAILAGRARELGYRSRTPIYLHSAQPLVEPGQGRDAFSVEEQAGASPDTPQLIGLNDLGQNLGSWAQAETTP